MNNVTASHIEHNAVGEVAREVLRTLGVPEGQPVALLDIPRHGNVGDSLITLGEFELVRSMSARIVHCGSRGDDLDSTLSRIPDGSTILLHGGGNLGDLWPQNQVYRLEVTERAAPASRVIWLPQSVHFTEEGELLRRTREVVAKRRPAVLLRDKQSVELWENLFDSEALLCPDIGLIPSLPKASVDEVEVLHLFRRDKESTQACRGPVNLDWGDIPRPRRMERMLARHVTQDPCSWVRRVGERWSFERLAIRRVDRGLSLMAGAGVVHTDRLHAAVMALSTGRRVVAHDNSYGKISAVLGTWRDYIDPQAVHLRADACPVEKLGEIHSDESL